MLIRTLEANFQAAVQKQRKQSDLLVSLFGQQKNASEAAIFFAPWQLMLKLASFFEERPIRGYHDRVVFPRDLQDIREILVAGVCTFIDRLGLSGFCGSRRAGKKWRKSPFVYVLVEQYQWVLSTMLLHVKPSCSAVR